MIRISYLRLIVVELILIGTIHLHASPAFLNPTNSLSSSTNKMVIPVSVFTVPTNSANGRDPFYPDSTRFATAQSSTNSKPAIVSPALTLQGISGTAGNKLAIINGRTLAAGEETELTTSSTRLKIRCIEIKTDSATIEIDGVSRELHLRSSSK